MMMKLVLALAAATCVSGYIYPRPNPFDKPKFARWLVHESNWTILATSATTYGNVAFPNLLSTSDGANWTDCTGHVYIYYTSLSTIHADLQVNDNVTFGFYEVGEKDFPCNDGQHFDAEDPNCGKLHLVGRVKNFANATGHEMAEKYLFWRHPAMPTWPKDHAWITATVEITSIDLLSMYGPAIPISPEDYYASSCH
ncbi:hypothetical protein DIPPA_24405 [Diplonema papillatum]|nr:hypothetical protein DIPPA_24405 [Diplonema papillatum]